MYECMDVLTVAICYGVFSGIFGVRAFSVFGRFRFLGFRVFVSVCDTCAYTL